jgi:hypothetical protein
MANINKNQPLSPEKYIRTKVANLPYVVCYASADWQLSYELVTVLIGKEMPSGNICLGLFLIDKGCLGLKNTSYRFNLSPEEYESQIDKIVNAEGRDFVKISPTNMHNLIFGAIDYAEELGFQPNKDWAITKYFLNEDLITDDIDEIPFGKDGKPFYIAGPFDNTNHIIATLKRNLGEGNFDFVIPAF